MTVQRRTRAIHPLRLLAALTVSIFCASFSTLYSVQEASPSDSRTTKVYWYWLGQKPSLHVSAFKYYQGFGKALERHEYMEECRPLEVCREKLLNFTSEESPLFAVGIPHVKTVDLESLKSIESEFTTALYFMKNMEREVGGRRSSFKYTFAVFLNKVYHFSDTLEKKVNWVKERQAEFISNGLKVSPMLFTWSSHALEWQKNYSIPFAHVPFAVDLEMFDVSSSCRRSTAQVCDVFIRWDTDVNKYSRIRSEISQTLGAGSIVELNEHSSDYKFNVTEPAKFISHEEYLQTLQDCKVHVSTIGMPGRFDLVGTRYFEVMASGCALLFVERPLLESSKLAYKAVGIAEDVNVVMFTTLGEFIQKLVYYNRNPDLANAIVRRAHSLMPTNTWNDRAEKVFRHLVNEARR